MYASTTSDLHYVPFLKTSFSILCLIFCFSIWCVYFRNFFYLFLIFLFPAQLVIELLILLPQKPMIGRWAPLCEMTKWDTKWVSILLIYRKPNFLDTHIIREPNSKNGLIACLLASQRNLRLYIITICPPFLPRDFQMRSIS